MNNILQNNFALFRAFRSFQLRFLDKQLGPFRYWMFASVDLFVVFVLSKQMIRIFKGAVVVDPDIG